MLSASLSTLLGVLIILQPFRHVVLDVLNIRNFVFLCTMVDGGFWTGGILASVFCFGKCLRPAPRMGQKLLMISLCPEAAAAEEF